MSSAMLLLLHMFAATPDCSKKTFMGLVPWFQYLNVEYHAPTASCRITNFNDSTQALGAHSPFLLIGLAILEDLIRLAALIAVGYVIYGGFQYMTSQGAPDSTKKAQQTIINAVIGVVIAILAASGVAYLGHRLGA